VQPSETALQADAPPAPAPGLACGPERDAAALLHLIGETRARAVQDPFGNPVLTAALAISRQLDEGRLDEAQLAGIVAFLRDAAAGERAGRLSEYVGGADLAGSQVAIVQLAERLVRPNPEDSPLPLREVRTLMERPRYACVFTAHPTFALSPPVYAGIAGAASGGQPGGYPPSHRPSKPTLEEEFDAANAAISHGRDALDALCGALLDAAGAAFPQAWTGLNPAPVVLASWVGLDTDGRTDIGWWDSLRLRLRTKRLGLARLAANVAGLPCAAALHSRVEQALAAVDAQLALAPSGPDPAAVAPFARALIDGRGRRCCRRNRSCRCSPAPSPGRTRRRSAACASPGRARWRTGFASPARISG